MDLKKYKCQKVPFPETLKNRPKTGIYPGSQKRPVLAKIIINKVI
jgi:hypothetical protein